MVITAFKPLQAQFRASLLLLGVIVALSSVTDAMALETFSGPVPKVRVEGQEEMTFDQWQQKENLATQKAAAAETIKQFNLPGAWYAGLIDPIIYYYDPAISGSTESYVAGDVRTGLYLTENNATGEELTKKIAPTNGFWIRSQKDVGIVFPFYNETDPPAEGVSYTSDPGEWRFFSIPFDTGIKAPGSYTGATFLKWQNSNVPGDYGEFNNVQAFAPGRAYWVSGSFLLTGTKTQKTKDFTFQVPGWGSITIPQYLLKLEASSTGDYFEPNNPTPISGPVGDYMVGNPYRYSQIAYSDIWIEVPMYSTASLGKIASTPLELYNDMKSITRWTIDLKLSDVAGTRIDGGNIAGVIESGKDLHTLFNARDLLLPKSDYIRLAFKNPDDANALLAWDYRGPGQDTYEWTVELSTTIASIATKLSLSNFASIPAGYLVTLTDTSTGKVYSLTGDSTFDVALTSAAPKTFVLTATRQKPAAVSEAVPAAVALKNIFPNPFNPATTISFDVQKAGKVNMSVYNINGQLVDTLVNGEMAAGSHDVVWNAARHSSGVYIVQVTANGFTDTRKVTFMK